MPYIAQNPAQHRFLEFATRNPQAMPASRHTLEAPAQAAVNAALAKQKNQALARMLAAPRQRAPRAPASAGVPML